MVSPSLGYCSSFVVDTKSALVAAFVPAPKRVTSCPRSTSPSINAEQIISRPP